ncbi:uncharacterized protein BCR38DRAFT_480231 [Pseudomassariella vexata]|uniref:SAP domain-containing protein n=1 Tax=Pseudomassariella vexata TaxID=1141098 RepID=A0A1Y2EJK4_9PEZI|nr:uncharacterized protein BCR38DRAFT_480231 [Pseudomassariella vexata]ORY71743.1 hypothetical protein BCR38DRAFT_480231 [Pseudomassariella vexata]
MSRSIKARRRARRRHSSPLQELASLSDLQELLFEHMRSSSRGDETMSYNELVEHLTYAFLRYYPQQVAHVLDKTNEATNDAQKRVELTKALNQALEEVMDCRETKYGNYDPSRFMPIQKRCASPIGLDSGSGSTSEGTWDPNENSGEDQQYEQNNPLTESTPSTSSIRSGQEQQGSPQTPRHIGPPEPPMDYDQASSAELKDECGRRGLTKAGTKRDLARRLKAADDAYVTHDYDYPVWLVSALRLECAYSGLDDEGSRDTLIKRLQDHRDNGSDNTPPVLPDTSSPPPPEPTPLDTSRSNIRRGHRPGGDNRRPRRDWVWEEMPEQARLKWKRQRGMIERQNLLQRGIRYMDPETKEVTHINYEWYSPGMHGGFPGEMGLNPSDREPKQCHEPSFNDLTITNPAYWGDFYHEPWWFGDNNSKRRVDYDCDRKKRDAKNWARARRNMLDDRYVPLDKLMAFEPYTPDTINRAADDIKGRKRDLVPRDTQIIKNCKSRDILHRAWNYDRTPADLENRKDAYTPPPRSVFPEPLVPQPEGELAPMDDDDNNTPTGGKNPMDLDSDDHFAKPSSSGTVVFTPLPLQPTTSPSSGLFGNTIPEPEHVRRLFAHSPPRTDLFGTAPNDDDDVFKLTKTKVDRFSKKTDASSSEDNKTPLVSSSGSKKTGLVCPAGKKGIGGTPVQLPTPDSHTKFLSNINDKAAADEKLLSKLKEASKDPAKAMSILNNMLFSPSLSSSPPPSTSTWQVSRPDPKKEKFFQSFKDTDYLTPPPTERIKTPPTLSLKMWCKSLVSPMTLSEEDQERCFWQWCRPSSGDDTVVKSMAVGSTTGDLVTEYRAKYAKVPEQEKPKLEECHNEVVDYCLKWWANSLERDAEWAAKEAAEQERLAERRKSIEEMNKKLDGILQKQAKEMEEMKRVGEYLDKPKAEIMRKKSIQQQQPKCLDELAKPTTTTNGDEAVITSTEEPSGETRKMSFPPDLEVHTIEVHNQLYANLYKKPHGKSSTQGTQVVPPQSLTPSKDWAKLRDEALEAQDDGETVVAGCEDRKKSVEGMFPGVHVVGYTSKDGEQKDKKPKGDKSSTPGSKGEKPKTFKEQKVKERKSDRKKPRDNMSLSSSLSLDSRDEKPKISKEHRSKERKLKGDKPKSSGIAPSHPRKKDTSKTLSPIQKKDSGTTAKKPDDGSSGIFDIISSIIRWFGRDMPEKETLKLMEKTLPKKDADENIKKSRKKQNRTAAAAAVPVVQLTTSASSPPNKKSDTPAFDKMVEPLYLQSLVTETKRKFSDPDADMFGPSTKKADVETGIFGAELSSTALEPVGGPTDLFTGPESLLPADPDTNLNFGTAPSSSLGSTTEKTNVFGPCSSGTKRHEPISVGVHPSSDFRKRKRSIVSPSPQPKSKKPCSFESNVPPSVSVTNIFRPPSTTLSDIENFPSSFGKVPSSGTQTDGDGGTEYFGTTTGAGQRTESAPTGLTFPPQKSKDKSKDNDTSKHESRTEEKSSSSISRKKHQSQHPASSSSSPSQKATVDAAKTQPPTDNGMATIKASMKPQHESWASGPIPGINNAQPSSPSATNKRKYDSLFSAPEDDEVWRWDKQAAMQLQTDNKGKGWMSPRMKRVVTKTLKDVDKSRSLSALGKGSRSSHQGSAEAG